MKPVNIYRIPDHSGEGHQFKLCSVNFDEACVIKDKIQSDLFNIIWIKNGKGRYKIDFKSYEAEHDNIFFLAPGQILEVEDEAIRQGYRIAFSREFYYLESGVKDMTRHGLLFNNVYETAACIRLSESDKVSFERSVENLFEELENPGHSHKELIISYLNVFLIRATRLKRVQYGISHQPIKQSLIEKFNSLVEQHFKIKHAVSDYADILNISPKTLAKQLQNKYAQTPSEVIQGRLMLEAKRLLRFGESSVKEIAYELGFEDPGYFTRFFKKHSSVCPTDYAEQGRYNKNQVAQNTKQAIFI
ncbi:AraC family transcriptional regulator [Roseivirga sp. E12]|uniref:helix-turn-helix domain-containing protein n=1 Tax=Roseivirga sp. E12 TaxID=2819237 RepID=UPI001ABCF3F4|nr:AraC family transcriptional regulator [Roseivirga sp. E12]MBO3699095.1 helix-turn-helix domain-containing protein [Roseivirga sp. E12]